MKSKMIPGPGMLTGMENRLQKPPGTGRIKGSGRLKGTGILKGTGKLKGSQPRLVRGKGPKVVSTSQYKQKKYK